MYFQTECREAMTHYQAVFGGELEVTTFGDFGMVGEGDPGRVLHASLTVSEGLVLQAGDVTAGSTARTGGSIQISGSDEAQLRGWFDALTRDGEVHMPLQQAAWGGLFGQGADRFGITWLVNVAPDGN
nr:VOC family protein [Kribbella italica]